MDVSAPITAAIPGVAGRVVAALLSTTEPLTETQVARACPGVSHAGVRKALHRHVDTGVVLSVPGGYVLNRDHLVFPSLELLDGLYGGLRRRMRKSIEEWGGSVVCAGLFGSAARHDGDAKSDIDVLLVADDELSGDFALELAADVQLWTGNRCHVMVLTRTELRRMKQVGEPIVDEWADHLDTLVGSFDSALGAGEERSA